MENAICVDIKGHFDLWHATWCCWNTIEVKLTNGPVVFGHFPLTLNDINFYGWLIVSRCRKRFCFSGWNGCISFYETGCYTSHSFDSQRKWCDIQKQNIFYIARKNPGLNGCTKGNDFIRVNSAMRVFAKEVLNEFLCFWNSCGTTDQNCFMNLICLYSCIFHGLNTGGFRSFDEITYH